MKFPFSLLKTKESRTLKRSAALNDQGSSSDLKDSSSSYTNLNLDKNAKVDSL